MPITGSQKVKSGTPLPSEADQRVGTAWSPEIFSLDQTETEARAPPSRRWWQETESQGGTKITTLKLFAHCLFVFFWHSCNQCAVQKNPYHLLSLRAIVQSLNQIIFWVELVTCEQTTGSRVNKIRPLIIKWRVDCIYTSEIQQNIETCPLNTIYLQYSF